MQSLAEQRVSQAFCASLRYLRLYQACDEAAICSAEEKMYMYILGYVYICQDLNFFIIPFSKLLATLLITLTSAPPEVVDATLVLTLTLTPFSALL